MLFDSLDAILGARSKVRLLRVLAPLAHPVGGREAARLAGVSHHALAALNELVAVGIVRRDEGTGQHLFSLNRKHALARPLITLFETERRHTAAIFERIAAALDRCGGVVSAVVFGSAARGEAGPDSDLDLLVLAERGSDRLHDVLAEMAPGLRDELGVRLSPVVMMATQARRRYAERDAFIVEVLRDARRVSGVPLEDVLHS